MSNVTRLLPPNSTVLERAIATANAAIDDIPVPLRELWNPDTCPVALLPWLAWTFAVDQWDSNWSEAQKRDTIKSAIEVHRHRGTLGSVRQALGALGYDVKLQEWFAQAPAGAPYTFNLLLKIDQIGIDEIGVQKILRCVTTYKNLRSHINKVKTTVVSRGGARVAATTNVGHDITVGPGGSIPMYSDGTPANDLVVDRALNGESSTASAIDRLDELVRTGMPRTSWKTL